MRLTLILLGFLLVITSQAQQLPRYSSMLNRVDMDVWLEEGQRSFDSSGILTQNDEYHPVSICQFGLMALDRYQQTKDEEWLQAAENQVNHLTSQTKNDVLFDGLGLGLPYRFEYKGLEPPWYSGMAQGMAISFLLRYTEVSVDTSVHSAVHKLAYTLLQPQESGGCLSTTPEDLLWIEEYPNSTQSPQVLNGAIYGLFGLMDYCIKFPDSARAVAIKNECISSLKTALPFFDSKTWTNYNRRKVYPNRYDYIHIQIFQMWQLYAYLNDPFFLRQACIWSGMIHGKQNESTSTYALFTSENISVPGEMTEGSIKYETSQRELSTIEQIIVDQYEPQSFPRYVFAAPQPLEVSEKKVLDVALDSTLTDVHILYRYHSDKFLFDQQKWKASNGVSSNTRRFYLEPGYYQFAVFVPYSKEQDSVDLYKFHISNP